MALSMALCQEARGLDLLLLVSSLEELLDRKSVV